MTPGYRTHNTAQVVLGGPAYFKRLEQLVDGARRVVHVQVYIWAADATGRRIWEAVVHAARRGVAVFVLADGFAARELPRPWIDELRAAGGCFRWFSPLFQGWGLHLGRRLHHKVVVVDDRHALVSGRNIADRYTDIGKEPGWYDLALDVEGEAALDLAALCGRLWNASRGRLPRAPIPGDTERRALLAEWPRDRRCALRVRFNDWLRGRAEVTSSYLELLRTARHEAWLVSSYFVPGRRLRRAIRGATGRGVRVRLINAGPSDVLLAKPAERWLYAWLLRQGVEVHEYQRSVMHAKAGVCDDRWATLGSFNLNDLSAYTTLEVNLDVHDATVVQALKEELARIVRESNRRVTMAEERRVTLRERAWRWTAYNILRLTYGLLTFYYRRH